MPRQVKMLLEEQPLFSTFEILEDIHERSEALPKGVIMRVRGKFAHADRVTTNGTLYKRGLWEREVERIKPQLMERSILMLSDHPKKLPDGTTESPSVKNVVGGLTSLSVLPGGEVMGEAEFADTEAGRNAAAIVRAGFKLGTSSRARGTFTEQQMNEDDPLSASNQDWVGKNVKVVDENFMFKTFDVVVDQSVTGAKIDDFQEEETQDMPIDITKLTEDEWKKVLDSDKAKALVEAAVKSREEELKKDFEEKVRADITRMTEEYLKSDEFSSKFEPAMTEAEKNEFAKFLAMKKKKGKKDEEDADEGAEENANEERFQLMESKLEEVKKENAKLVEEARKAKERERVAVILEESLKGKSQLVSVKVRAELKDKELTEEDAQEYIKGRIDFIEAICKEAGVPPGKGPMMGGDREPPKQEELTEQEKAAKTQINMLSML